MKKLLIFVGVSLASGVFAATGVYTNVNGMVLGLELAQTSIVAGERLIGTMIISNASKANGSLSWHSVTREDTQQGSFVVADETGYTLPRTVPIYYWWGIINASSRSAGFGPGMEHRQAGDVVRNYSVTNPGNYLVKAAFVGLSLSDTRFQGETPWVAITVTPRPEGSPPPKPLYPEVDALSPQELAGMKVQEARWNELMAEQRRAAIKAAMPPAPRVAPRELPPKVQAVAAQPKNTFSATPDQPATTTRTRNILYALAVLLLVGGLGIYLRSRRRHGHP